ncbi:N-acyl amino acid synthase FeeM domain-containing protein [Massilia niabensis]|uniref:N-acyl amino acid synthase FeeM catalytic core domain-containing protein n=1 Tax=Massilia niabensis TaxID=544910 RepID=A0ABW0L8P2_9BURK
MELCQANVATQGTAMSMGPVAAVHEVSRTTERLPFTIRRVENEDDLLKAVRVRYDAYARHVPDFARSLALPEAADYESDTIVLLAESKLDGTALGTARIRTNIHHPLHIEESVMLPQWLQGRRLGEVERLGVNQGRIGHVVKVALVKAFFEYFENNGFDYAVITGRAPVDRQYEQLMFTDVFGEKEMVPMRHIGDIPHRVMAFEIATGEARWTAAAHPMLKFFRHTHHPDINVGPKAEPCFSAPRVPQRAPAASTSVAMRELALA